MPFKSPIFRKLLASIFLPVLATLLILDFYLTRNAARDEIETVQQQLVLEGRILSRDLLKVPAREFQNWSKQAGEVARARITVINWRGVVLADSMHDPETMENHAGRPEIRQALGGQVGASIRHSATLNHDLCYVAFPIPGIEGRNNVLRLAVPLERLDADIAAIRWRILWASFAAGALALAGASILARLLTGRVTRLRAFAESVADLEAVKGPPFETDDELGVLARSLYRMAERLHELIDSLRLESARRDAILASMAEGVVAVDNEFKVLFCNQSFARLVGSNIPVRERMPILELARDPQLLDLLSRVMVTGQHAVERWQVIGALGRSFEVHAAPLAGPSRRGAIALLHDITELERLERVRKDFVANVSHELRTPLTAIQGYAETLLEGAIDDAENKRKFVEIIKAHAVRLNDIASDLLTISELESAKPVAEQERVSVPEVVEAALRTVESKARALGVKLVCEKLEDAQVVGEKLRLEQALVNLLDNAIKFNRPGGEVRLGCVRTAEGQVSIAVADTGIGISSEHLPRIFERFYRVDGARSRELGGTGLGLSIVKHIAERMGGTVTVDSQLGVGSTFQVILPASPEQKA